MKRPLRARKSNRWRVAGDVISHHLSLVTRHILGVGGAGGERGLAGECELRGQEQFSAWLPGIRPRRFSQTQSAEYEG